MLLATTVHISQSNSGATGWYILGVLAAVVAAVAAVVGPAMVWYAKHEQKKARALKNREESRLDRENSRDNKVNDLYVALLGQDSTLTNPTPAPGLLERVESVETNQTSVMDTLARLEKQVTPNGGNTNRLGDRIVKIERALKVGDCDDEEETND